MKKRLPLTIEPTKAAQKRLEYRGIYAKQSVRRLVDSVERVNDDINAALSFTIDSQYLTVISLVADVELSLICQRCGDVFKYAVHIEGKFSPVKSHDPAVFLPEEYNPVELNEFGEVDLLALVEDEIILSLPLIPLHKMAQCGITKSGMVFGQLAEDEEKTNPFAKLADLNKK